MARTPALFPLFLKLDGRRCLVVGAGAIGEAKIARLLETGARVVVVSPTATAAVAAWAEAGRIEWRRRRVEAGDLDGMALVVGAIPRGEALSGLAREARRRGVLCNAVDDPVSCDFYYPAVVSRGDLQIAISTGGHSPALAQRLRVELEAQFGPDYESWIAELGRRREALFRTTMDPAERRQALHALASRDAFERHRAGDPAASAGSPDAGSAAASVGRVYLVGAGPGDPELLTLKALRVLGSADLVLHDDLVPAAVLELAPPGARVQSVGKRHGGPRVAQEDIHRLLIAGARAGQVVVRLKGGDVGIFGRASEELDALRAAGVEVEVVPGVTAASAGAAAAAVSLTDRRRSSAVVLVTGQTADGHPGPDWRALATLGATVAVYMPGERYDRLARELLDAGLGPDTPCLVVSRASQDDEQVVATTIAALGGLTLLPTPAIVLLGDVLAGTGVRALSRTSAAI